MSYHFDMTFYTAPDRLSAFSQTQELANLFVSLDNAKVHLRQTLPFAISQYNSLSGNFKKPFDPDDGAFRQWLDTWVRSAFHVHSVYWPELHLLGVLGNVPEVVFGTHPIPFQNSTDQDYDLDIWPNLDFFTDIIKKYSDMSDKEVLQERYGEDVPYSKPVADYSRLSLVYEKVFEALDLDSWLYDRRGNFERISMNGLTTTDLTTQMSLMATVIAKTINI